MRSIWVPKKSFEQPSSLNLCKLLLLSYEQHTRTQQHQLIIVLTFRSKILILFHHPQSSVIKIHWKMIDFQFESTNLPMLRVWGQVVRAGGQGLLAWHGGDVMMTWHGAMIKMMIWPQWRYWHEICSRQSSKTFVCLFSLHFHFYFYLKLERDCIKNPTFVKIISLCFICRVLF